MTTIAHLTKKIIQNKPFIHEALEKELINLGALAESMKPEIEKELGYSVKISAISMAIRRYVETKKNFLRKVRLSKKSDLIVKSDLFEISLRRSNTIHEKIRKLYDIVDFDKGGSLNIIHGNYEILIVGNEIYKKRFLEALKGEKVIESKSNISSISIRIPEECIEIPGFYFAITKTLALENISILDIVNTRTEATLILNDDDIPNAYAALKREINIEYYK